MKIILRLLPVPLIALGLNSCVVAPGPGPGGVTYSAGVSTGGYADDGDGDMADPDTEVGYWSPAGVYSAVYLPGYERDYVYYDGYGHRSRFGGYNRHGRAVHHHGHIGGHGHTSSSHHTTSHTTTNHTTSHTTNHTTTHGRAPANGAPSFKAAQGRASTYASQKKGTPPKKKEEKH